MDLVPYVPVGAAAGGLALGYIYRLRKQLAAANQATADLRGLGVLPVAETKDADVFICSYPRSGNNWFSYMVAGLTQGCNASIVTSELFSTIIPDLHTHKFYKRCSPVTYFKSHHLPQPSYKRVVYLLRDGRDVMVSYYHFQAALKESVDFLKMISDRNLSWPCPWHEHVETWMTNPYHADMLVVKYEDLKSQPVREMRRFCDFAGLKHDDAMLERIIAEAAFDKMHAKEKKGGFAPDWPKKTSFFRRGQVNSHVDEMPPEVLDAFIKMAGPTLARFGYLAPLKQSA